MFAKGLEPEGAFAKGFEPAGTLDGSGKLLPFDCP